MCIRDNPIAAIMAVGVASTKAHGQNTTKTVTAFTIFPVNIYAHIAISKATGTRSVSYTHLYLTHKHLSVPQVLLFYFQLA